MVVRATPVSPADDRTGAHARGDARASMREYPVGEDEAVVHRPGDSLVLVLTIPW
jgi:hypothetical protein